MSAFGRLRAAQRSLVAASAASAALWGVAAAVSVFAAAGAVDLVVALPRPVRALTGGAAALAATVVALALLYRRRRARSPHAVALWLEEQVPALRYALVTLLEPRFAYLSAQLEAVVSGVRWDAPLRRAVVRAVRAPTAVAAVAVVALVALPDGALRRVVAPRPGDTLERVRGGARMASRLVPLIATVTPPAYARGSPVVIEEPTMLSGLVGSDVVLEGVGDAQGLEAAVADSAARVIGERGRWRVAIRMPVRAAAVRLSDGTAARLIALEPIPDSAPRVVLGRPAHDTVLRAPTGSIALAAELSDDLGLRDAWFEYIVSSGEGETFTFESGTVRRTSLSGRHASLRAALSLDALGLGAGDVVHVRAIARDRKTIDAPGVGASETRTIRVARAGEYDSVAVEAAPPPAEQSALSQRMLIMLAEALERRRPRLRRATVVTESRAIAADQARLRRRVAEIIFDRLEGEGGAEHAHGEEDDRTALDPEALMRAAEAAAEHSGQEVLDFEGGESPVVAINRPLLEAYNAMWDAGRELEVGEPGRALPHMRAALAAIQRARAAERVYLRGRPPAVVVDVAKVRLAGKRDVDALAPRTPRAATDDALGRALARFAVALRLLGPAPSAAVDSLLLLRVDAVESAPELAAALSEAIASLRGGRDATLPLARARRAIAGAPVARDSLPAWGIAW